MPTDLLYLLSAAGQAMRERDERLAVLEQALQDKDRELIALRKIVSQSVSASVPHPDGQERLQPQAAEPAATNGAAQ